MQAPGAARGGHFGRWQKRSCRRAQGCCWLWSLWARGLGGGCRNCVTSVCWQMCGQWGSACRGKWGAGRQRVGCGARWAPAIHLPGFPAESAPSAAAPEGGEEGKEIGGILLLTSKSHCARQSVPVARSRGFDAPKRSWPSGSGMRCERSN